ncbi:4-hydroxy-tetrahydrodipicolinate reductase [Hydromonas duriensis]|uniref:4-hydroxy-tetrahydrodipicolinate reductase n=1 Tax=Hydromonas duriensis TaxID=1527608 RepID=A0A4R6YA18_9BURK|nr:4-hydroxy-tetrahydrodipicolinate reductase [Hydromonas duriensis]TDR32314.1 dihydrodipicolinate reductase [Hydromonas duriensis]
MKLVITGASGRMGRMLIETALQTDGIILHGALDSANSAFLGKDAGEFLGQTTGVLISNDVEATLMGADCVIDFTRPEATLAYLPICIKHNINCVIGTTGFDDAGKAEIHAAGAHIGVVFAPNMGVGVNATLKILELAAKILNSGYDIEIVEAHHRLKVDAPSGTALKMGEVVANALGRDLKDCAIYGREGVTGVRDDQTIGFSTIRGGDVIGDHTVMFMGQGERVEITHKSSSRITYATGAMRAAKFLNAHGAGYYDMQDVLGLKD